MSLITFPDYVYDTSKVPQAFQALLPSSPVANLEPQRDKRYIISSFLKTATLDAWKWMLNTYSKEDIILEVKTTRHLIKKDVTLWMHYYNIPEEEIRCLQPMFPSGHKKSWVW